jgi:hypothetical protein
LVFYGLKQYVLVDVVVVECNNHYQHVDVDYVLLQEDYKMFLLVVAVFVDEQ